MKEITELNLGDIVTITSKMFNYNSIRVQVEAVALSRGRVRRAFIFEGNNKVIIIGGNAYSYKWLSPPFPNGNYSYPQILCRILDKDDIKRYEIGRYVGLNNEDVNSILAIESQYEITRKYH